MEVPAEEVTAMLIEVVEGCLVPCAVERTFKEEYCGDVEFRVGGWRVWVFNDCDSFDYIDHVVTPDGRRGEFGDWWPDGGECDSPENKLTHEQAIAMEKAFEEAGRC